MAQKKKAAAKGTTTKKASAEKKGAANDSPKAAPKSKVWIRPKSFRTGIEGFDDLLLKGGVPWGSSLIVEGGPGSGKTLFCLQMGIRCCERGMKVLYMSFEEQEKNLLDHMRMFHPHPEQFIESGNLLIRRFNALDIARSVEALLSEAKKELLIDVQPVLIPEDFEPDLVLIDSLTSIASAFSGESYRFRIYMEQLFRYLETHKMTSFLIRETPKPTHTGQSSVDDNSEAVSFISDGIIVIYNVLYGTGKRGRALEIFKLRGTEFDRKLVELEIDPKKGVVVHSNKVLKGKYVLT